MPHRPPTFTQADIARAIRAMKAAGYDVRVRITRDGAVVEPMQLDASLDMPPPPEDEPETIYKI